MRTPEFNAEASLYKTSDHYQLKNVYEGSSNGSSTAVYPAAVSGVALDCIMTATSMDPTV